MARGVIAVVLDDGTVLASSVAIAGDRLAAVLEAHWNDPAAIADLAALGDLLEVGVDAASCRIDDGDDGLAAVHGGVLPGPWELECLRPADHPHLHIHERGAWIHETDPWAVAETDATEGRPG